MTDTLTITFADDVSWQQDDGDSVRIQSSKEGVVFRRLSPSLIAALEALRGAGIRLGALREQVMQEGGFHALARLDYLLLRLERYGLITYSVACGGRPLAVLTPTSPDFRLPPAAPQPGSWQLSRFAFSRLDNGRMVAESPRGHAVVYLPEPGMAAVLACLARPLTPGELAVAAARYVPEAGESEWRAVLYLLRAAAVIVPVSEEGQTEETTDPAFEMWSFHELLFHTRTRVGRHRLPLGGTYRFVGKLPPLPAVKPVAEGSAPGGDGIDLPKPDIEQLAAQDPPFTRVLEARRSVRKYGSDPISVEQLGEFLYRSLRIQQLTTHHVPVKSEMDGSTPGDPSGASVPVELVLRPTPAGGALHELETYAVVNRCRGLASGLYWYDPLHHRLHPALRDAEAMQGLLKDAQWATRVSSEPQVLIILATRFGRLAWKYESMAYALTLKHAGAALQTMYLVATAMGLACTAIGAGNSDLFAKAAGTDYYAETSVAEFLLGTRAP